ncbi:MAG: transposase, partial [Treponema sp.]|nr:transposase [Treponema sp.]
YAEQKNYDAVRKTVGYFRFDTTEECAALGEVYRWLCPLYNYWMPSFRLVAKEKQADGRYRKVYEKEARTPYERLMESPDISEECKGELRRRRAGQNPVALNRKLNEAVGVLLKINREKDKVKQASCQEDGRAGAA